MLFVSVLLAAVAAVLVIAAPGAVRSGRAGGLLAAAVVVTAIVNIVILASTHESATQVLCSVTSGLLIGTLYRWSFALRQAQRRRQSNSPGRPSKEDR